MYCVKEISYDKAFKLLELIVFIGLTFVAVWFGSGVIEQFLSNKTSFLHYEEEVAKYPVVAIRFHQRQASEVNQNSVEILYHIKGTKNKYLKLKIGENHLPNGISNETDVVNLDSLEDLRGRMVFRIMHATPISKLENNRPNGKIKLYTKFEDKLGLNMICGLSMTHSHTSKITK